MSMSNDVKIVAIKETVYGETPVAGNFFTPRFTSESLSGTPTTVESQTLRTDRMSSGQIVVGLEVGGDINVEMTKDAPIDAFVEAAMYNTWNTLAPITEDIVVDAAAKTITAAAGTFITDGLKKGDFFKLSTMANTENNVRMLIAGITETEIKYISEKPLVNETKAGAVITRDDKLTIGKVQNSFSMEKIFTTLTTKAIEYRGMIVSAMELTAAYGALMTGTFTFQGNDYKAVDTAGDMMSDGRTITPQGTSDSLNGSIDMPFLATSATGAALSPDDLCIQTVTVGLDNSTMEKTCIGKSAPEGYDPGTARVSVSLSTYLKDSSWPLLPKKLTQTPFELAFAVQNSFGGYGFYLPAVQTSSDDPQAGGADQQMSLELEGVAKVGDATTGSEQSALAIFRFTA